MTKFRQSDLAVSSRCHEISIVVIWAALSGARFCEVREHTAGLQSFKDEIFSGFSGSVVPP